MAMLASKSYPAGLGPQSSNMMAAPRRAATTPLPSSQNHAAMLEAEFGDLEPETVKKWDEDDVCHFLRRLKWGQYEDVFRKNNINGENLLELDKTLLQEMGVEKVGDRVRLWLTIKKLRTMVYANQARRQRVRCGDDDDDDDRLLFCFGLVC